MKQLASIVFAFGFAFGIALAGCGGKSGGGATPSGGGGAAADRLPWEAAMTKGARFELKPDIEPDGGAAPTTLVATVTEVEDQGAVRIYHLSWMEGEDDAHGPAIVRVEGGKVIIGADTALASMVEPLVEQGGATCYAEDYSNPDGCEDVCEASLCLDGTGITAVSGLYAPGYMPYSVH